MKKTTKKKVATLADAAAVAMPREERETLRVRKISNGYVVCHETYKNGQYKETETFTPKKPDLKLPGGAPRPKA